MHVGARARAAMVGMAAAALITLPTACTSPPRAALASPADYFAYYPNSFASAELDTVFDSGFDGFLIGPHFSVDLHGTTVTDRLSLSDAEDHGLTESLRAPDGHEIVVSTVSADPDEWFAWEADGVELEAEVIIGDRVEELPAVPGPDAVIAAIAPEGEPVLLAVTDSETTQKLNLRDGTRTEEVAAYYQRDRWTDIDDTYDEVGYITALGVTRDVDCQITFSYAFVDPWNPDEGWAKEGRTWLSVTITSVASNAYYGFDPDPDKHEPAVDWQFSLKDSFSVDPEDDGEAKARTKGTVDMLVGDYDGFTVVFDVPADMEYGTLKVHPKGKMTAEWSDGEEPTGWSDQPDRGSFGLEFPAV